MRGSSSREHLSIRWQFPTYTPKQRASAGESRSVDLRQALPLGQAFEVIAAEDPRPLLVLRECLTCTGTDDALLSRQADNEKTMLMTRWFRCVKLPPDVLKQDHPFHTLFDGSDAGHLFVSLSDGSQRIDLDGGQSRTELWKVMGQTLAAQYASNHEKHLKKLFSLLGRFDELDKQLQTANAKLEEAIERHGPTSSKMAKAQAKVRKLRIAKGDLDREMKRHSKLKLRKQPKPE